MTRPTLFAVLLFGFLASACTAILVPDEGDDGVQRCDNTGECDPIDDNRLEAVCVFGEGQDEGSQKVCAVAYAEPQCVPDAFAADHPFRVAYEEAQASLGTRYMGCEAGENGVGCPPVGDQCADGLEINAQGFCDDGEGLPAVEVDGDNIGQDVLDQFCRYRFCDDSFVCDRSAGSPTCVPCDDADAFGEGGCGELYSAPGLKSSVYLSGADTDKDTCGSHEADSTKFGELPPEP